MTERAKTLSERGRRSIGWVVRNAAILGIVLALICQFLPESYRVVCKQIAHICTGDIP